MKIYLAGPEVFHSDPIASGEVLKRHCRAHGAQGLFPMDNALPSPAPADIAAHIRTANMALIAECDAVIANMTPFRGVSMDVGTAYEMGAARALGKVVVGYYLGERRSYVERVVEAGGVERGEDGRLRDGEGWSVEEFWDGEAGGEGGRVGLVENLMMAKGVDGLVGSAEEAVRVAVQILREREEGKLKAEGGI